MNIQDTSLKFFRLLIKPGFFLLSLLAVSGFFAASGRADLAPDNSFLPPNFAKATPAENALLLPDGKYLLYFDPDTLTDQQTGPLTRFLPNGTLDASFNFSREYKTVSAVAVAGNGQLYVAATRYSYGVKEAEEILRVNADGSIDPTFGPATVGGTHAFTDVRKIIVQPDGKVLVEGFFLNFGGNPSRQSLVRLLTDGALDSGFAAITSNGDLYGLALQSDGKVLISGRFTTVNGMAEAAIARLNTDGTLDSGFQASGFSRANTGPIRGIGIQPDGLIVISGNFRIGTTSNAPRMPVIRLNANGAFDSTFNSSGIIPTINTGRELVIQPDGKIVAAVNNSVYRFNTNGSNDTSFRHPLFLDGTLMPPTTPGIPMTVNLAPDGRILAGGTFTDVDPSGAPNYAHFGVVRFLPDGNVDSTLISSRRTANDTAPSSMARLDDGSALVAFSDKVDPAITYNVGRLSSNGTIDSTFILSSSDPNRFLNDSFLGIRDFSARGVERLPDGKFFVYGTSEIYSNTHPYGKVDSQGVEDLSFAAARYSSFEKATVAPDGKILLASGSNPQMTVSGPFARLTADGQYDQFDPSSAREAVFFSQVIRDAGFGNMITELYVGNRVIAIQPDGEILYQYFSQDKQFHFVRFTADGLFDGTFAETTFAPPDVTESFPVIVDPQCGGNCNPYEPFDGTWSATPSIQDAHIQPDGRIIVTGHFTTFGNTPAHGIVRLMPDGTVDPTFNSGGGAQWIDTIETATFFPTVENIEPATDGKVIVTGTFEAFNGSAASGIARLNADGSVDTSFIAPVHRDKRSRVASAFKAQPDGSFLLSGPYMFAGESTPRPLIRLINAQPGAVNISTRLGVGTGENVLIEGFIVQGPAGSSKNILVRAIGPSLSQFGIADALANPTLEIHDGTGALVASNNDWKTTQVGGLVTNDQFAEINASGAAPENDLESALIVALEPGNYTAVVRGFGDTVGTGVVDAFDLDSGSAARLANIATRGLVQPGDQLMIAGFIVRNGAVKLVVRAIGPSLGAFGVSNALPDTTLQLRDQQGAIVLENDDWKSSQQQELESIGLQPSHDLEAALVATIQPGQYTAQVRGKGNDSGIGVVQVYFLQ